MTQVATTYWGLRTEQAESKKNFWTRISTDPHGFGIIGKRRDSATVPTPRAVFDYPLSPHSAGKRAKWV